MAHVHSFLTDHRVQGALAEAVATDYGSEVRLVCGVLKKAGSSMRVVVEYSAGCEPVF
jgi:hypothetical protein